MVVEAVGLAVEVEGEGRELAVVVFQVIADDEAASHEQVVELEEALAEMPSADAQQNILSVVVRRLARGQPREARHRLIAGKPRKNVQLLLELLAFELEIMSGCLEWESLGQFLLVCAEPGTIVLDVHSIRSHLVGSALL